MKSHSWLEYHVNMVEFFGGIPIQLICDNLKIGVVKHPKEGDNVLNAHYEALVSHYVMTIMPPQVRKPKQKSAVEDATGKIATAIIMSDPFKKHEDSCQLIFEETEQIKPHPLPAVPYEITDWIMDIK